MVLAAIYLLWSYQRMAYGPIHEEHRHLPDVNLREVLVLAPVLALLLVFGVFPKLLTDRIDPTAKAVIAHVDPPDQTTDVGTSPRPSSRRDGDRAVIATPEARVRADPPGAHPVRGGASSACCTRRSLRRPERLDRIWRSRSPGLIAAALATFPLWHWAGTRHRDGREVSRRPFSVVARLLLLGIAAIGLRARHALLRATRATRIAGSTTRLVLFATAGMTLITAAADLILVFLALEILSLSLYVLTGITGRADARTRPP